MKNLLLIISCILLATIQAAAHYLWIETDATGNVNKEQEIRVYFGEYTYGVIEKVDGEAFPNVKDFTLWVVDAAGNKSELQVTAADSYYAAKFTPKTEGTHTVILNNDKIDVIDYTQYDFGIFKTHYHSIAKIQVGKPAQDTKAQNSSGIAIKRMATANDEIKLQVFYKDKPLADNEVKIFVADLWSKALTTDENGFVSFKLPWHTKYIVETTIKEEVPGTYKGENYEFVWHCATHCIQP